MAVTRVGKRTGNSYLRTWRLLSAAASCIDLIVGTITLHGGLMPGWRTFVAVYWSVNTPSVHLLQLGLRPSRRVGESGRRSSNTSVSWNVLCACTAWERHCTAAVTQYYNAVLLVAAVVWAALRVRQPVDKDAGRSATRRGESVIVVSDTCSLAT